MSISASMIAELEQEAVATRRVLQSLPEDQFSWRPHPKSFSLGELGLHVAQIPGAIVGMATQNLDTPPTFKQAAATSTAELLDTLDASLATAKASLGGWDDAAMAAEWSMSADGKPIMAMPRMALLRMVMLNHWYHHRGQLLVYLRLLDRPVPSVYGPTADENPFG